MGNKRRQRQRRQRRRRRQHERQDAAIAYYAPVLACIRAAFEGVPPPDREHRTLLQAEAWDSYTVLEPSQQGREHEGSWELLPDRLIERCQYALPHLDEQGIHYYLPAIMSHYLRTGGKQGIHRSLLDTLRPSTGELKAYQRKRLAPLTFAQREAVLAFLEAVEAGDAQRLPWRRVVEAGDTADWFRKFY